MEAAGGAGPGGDSGKKSCSDPALSDPALSALGVGRGRGRLTLAQLGQAAGGMDCAALGQAVSRFGRRWGKDPTLRREVTKIESQLSNVSILPQCLLTPLLLQRPREE